MPDRDGTLIGQPLTRLKFEVASELAPLLRTDPYAKLPPGLPGAAPTAAASAADWERLKFEIAQELGVPLRPGYNGDLPAREAGRLGGKIGGNMVRRMIQLAEQALAQGYVPRP